MKVKSGVKTRIGLLGGLFDPIHNGHLHIAGRAVKIFSLDRVYFVLTARSPHKKKSYARAIERFEMAKIALSKNPRFKLSRVEMNANAPSYSFDTVKKFKKRFSDIYFIIGVDAFGEIESWKSAERLLSSCNFIVASRPGAGIKKALSMLDKSTRTGKMEFEFLKTGKKECSETIRVSNSPYRIYFCPSPEVDVSSTMVRAKITKGDPIKTLVPDGVEQYIMEKGLYIK